MNILDILFILIGLFFAARGVFRGFVVEIFSLLAFIIGVWAAIIGYPFLVSLLDKNPGEITGIVKLLIYGGIFIGIYILVKVIEKIISKFITVVLLTGLNRVLGLGLGILEAIIIIRVIFTVLISQDIIAYDFEALFASSEILKYIETYFTIGRDFLGV